MCPGLQNLSSHPSGSAGQSSLGRRSLVIVCGILFLSPSGSLMASVCAHCTTSLFRSLVSSHPPHDVRVCTPHNSSLFSGQASSCLPDWIYMSLAYLNTLVHRQACAITSLAKCTSSGSRRSVLSYRLHLSIVASYIQSNVNTTDGCYLKTKIIHHHGSSVLQLF